MKNRRSQAAERAALERENRELRSFRRVSEIALTHPPLASLYEQFLEEVSVSSGFPFVVLEAYEPVRELLRCEAVWGVPIPELRGVETPVEGSLAGSAVSSAGSRVERLSLDDAAARPLALAGVELRTCVYVPMRVEGGIFGVLSLGSGEALAPDDRFLRWLEDLGGQIAMLLERKRYEEERRCLLRDLNERVKELRTLHETSRLLQSHQGSTPELLQRLAWLLPFAWQYPETTEVRIRYGEIEGATTGFLPSPWCQQAAFHTADGTAGRIEVVYLEERPPSAEGPFLAEERYLLESLAEMLRNHLDRLEAEHKVQASESRLRLVVEQMPAVLWTTDAELRFTSCRGVGLSGLGLPPGEIEGRGVIDFYSDGDNNAVPAHLRALGGESVSYSQELRERLFECHVEPLRDAEGRIDGCIGAAMDVTVRKQAEEELRVLSETLEALVEASPLAILALDEESRVTLWSPAAERTFGWRRDEVLGLRLPTVPGDRWDEHLSVRGSVLAGERFTGIETRRCDRAGAVIDVRISVAPLRDAGGRVRGMAEFLEDITDRRRAERAIRRLASLPEQSPDPLVELDFAGNALYVNQAARLRFPDLQALGTWHPVLSQVSPILARFRQGDRKSFSFEVGYEGSVYHQMIYYVPDGHVVRVFLHDVTEQRRVQALLELQASRDGLTGLANRESFLRRVEERLRKEGAPPCAVLAIDLDRFKVINDSLGHAAGDELLTAVGQRIAACLGTGDSAARLGGDEFAVLLRETLGTSEAFQVAERLCEAVRLPLELCGQEVFPSAAVGIAPGEGYRDSELLLRDAHVAMYQAKALGGGRCEVFDPVRGRRSFDRLCLENELRRAVERRELELVYQPIVSLLDGSITAFEALMRWPRQERGAVSPAEFIPIAEESGLILPLSYWALGEVCQRLREWSGPAGDGDPVS
ncbi:MAG TPA: diguanylate cyclase, partial [Thermoanaerobaculia bacterium]|nr:diguanylate cyclase [Thermoanaerobaculia bacterium]